MSALPSGLQARPGVTPAWRHGGLPGGPLPLPELSDGDFQDFCRLIDRQAGIFLSEQKKELLQARLSKLLRARGLLSFRDYFRQVVEDRTGRELTLLLDAVSTNQTAFLRDERKEMIAREHILPLTRQSCILELSRSSLYYKAAPFSDRDLERMRLIDEIHLKYPFYGIRRIRNELRDLGHDVGRDHVSTLMRKMGIRALYQKPRLSKPHPEHKVYPYLLRGMEITRANHVWSSDITYIPMAKGFCYLTAIMDWASRRVLAWRLSTGLVLCGRHGNRRAARC